ncbi:fimbrial protein [Phytobacter palmae]|uniref:Fimbrial protein n=1 Tax=Phytobacter palmae TaxID=1855371 RepID=A0ABU9V1N9_9ENTR
MKKLQIAINLSLLLGLYIVAPYSQAGCSTTQLMQFTSNIPAGTTLAIPRDMTTGPVGNVISIPDSPSGAFNCWGGTSFAMLRFASAMEQSSIAGVYKTNIAGIGVKISDTGFPKGSVAALSNDVQKWYTYGTGPYTGAGWLTGIKLQFYITGPVSTGIITLPTPTVELWANDSLTTANGARYVILSVGGSVTVKTQSCETPNISVDLDKHENAEFSGINSKSSAKAFDFQIKNCSAGMNSVNYTFSPAAGVTLKESGTANQYITLDASSTASGVGIQMLYNDGSIVPFNSKINYAGYNKTIGGSYIIPMKARYIQTASNIRGGTANSAVEFTMSYE